MQFFSQNINDYLNIGLKIRISFNPELHKSVLSFSSLLPAGFGKPLRNILLISSLSNRFNRVVDTLIINHHLRIEDSFTLTTALALKISTPKDFKENCD